LTGLDEDEDDGTMEAATFVVAPMVESNMMPTAEAESKTAPDPATEAAIQALAHDDDIYAGLPQQSYLSPLKKLQVENPITQGPPPAAHMSLPPVVSIPQQVPSTVEEVTDDEFPSEWEYHSSPTPSSSNKPARSGPKEVEEWDAAQEMDVAAEEGDFVEFISQVKGQDLEATRKEINKEIRDLNKQKKIAIRDSEDITQHMISQIMVSRQLLVLQ
jgi:hypothetical protein